MPKILLVDDDKTLLTFLAEFLSDKYQVVTANNGQEALRQAYSEQPQLVILDVMMPGMDGWEVTARLRELSTIPIIMLTGKTTEADKLRGFSLGIDDYVTKPFSFAELSARISAVLNRVQRRTGTLENIIVIDELIIDLNRRDVRLGSAPVNLTPTEFRLLEILARRHGKAVSEEELTKKIWGDYRSEDSTVLRRYIWSLRSKIENDPANPRWIVNVRGYGYMLE
ncbi:MAG: DNA-binding response regulator [Chloroflexi bacterium HGW-Chloroflexi-10]|nr:MAG: DNA-binding response regulator [Chloroflexi bacterium HGW-Chloroflexi-10]